MNCRTIEINMADIDELDVLRKIMAAAVNGACNSADVTGDMKEGAIFAVDRYSDLSERIIHDYIYEPIGKGGKSQL